MMQRPQFFPNTLTPPTINTATLAASLEELRIAVRNGAEQVKENTPLPESWGSHGIFRSFPGIALAFLRLDYQSSMLEGTKETSTDYRQLGLQRIPSGLPEAPLLPSRLSPTGSSSPLTAITLRILAALAKEDWKNGNANIAVEDISCLLDAVQMALKNEPLVAHDGRRIGGDEMIFGRAGLLWTLLNVRTHTFDEQTQKALTPVLGKIPELIRVVIDAGRQGSKSYIEMNGDQEAHPLMYAWMEDHYCFGAVHGITGILAIILSAKPDELAEHLPVIGDSITALCKLSISSNGHLPMALPPFSYGQRSELVQLCHGTPGLLILLAAALKNTALTRAHWDPSWDQAIYLGTERVWEEGLLSKGGSLCHGISGNAWPWLLLHHSFEYLSKNMDDGREAYLQRAQVPTLPNPDVSQKLTGDFFLSRALAFMLHARETRPYNTSSTSSDKDYRMPDEPYALFEGLAGNVCAWADTCAVLQAKLRKMELVEQGICATSGVSKDEAFQEALRKQVGFPALGGNGATGLY
ncbi:hypothetical protein PENARI_c001G03266 [Penicillium arizonense]|uniref:Lanthionine synthetase C family protein n=1 Tax=Penicillium arizonense TaxID=1835702 RepID=A0A1F5LXH7_PENAI|nr:hypothetical protein PENARI_c001G03266 [Penicillium arizonense]OGE57867.1 hypothetical protein PENARI_c001G03266 [Penicillium arizonense]